MKRIALLSLFVVTVAAAERNFFDQLKPEHRELAGIAHLTPEQQSALNAFARRYAEENAEHMVARARDRVRAEIQAEAKLRNEANAGLAARGDDAPIATRIAGDFRGWDKGTTFRLQNGQVWQVDGPADSRFFPKRTDPEVELRPSGAFGGWKLYIQPEGLWVRVKRIK